MTYELSFKDFNFVLGGQTLTQTVIFEEGTTKTDSSSQNHDLEIGAWGATYNIGLSFSYETSAQTSHQNSINIEVLPGKFKWE
jgi:hypothetical protein